MKRTFLTTILAIFLFIGFLACNDNEEECNCPFSVSEFSHTECKNQTKGVAEAEYMKLKAEGNYIIVSKCICPYDLKYKLGKLKHGKYRIVLKKNNNPVTEFDIVFNDELDTTVSINP